MAATVDIQVNVERLKMIQAVIARLAGNSFLLKGWTVTLVAGLSAFSRTESNRAFALIAVVVVLILGVLDAYYLALERKYRRLYERAAVEGDGGRPWSLSVDKPGLRDLLSALRSGPVWLLHGAALVLAVIVATWR